jgi:hypothetical protein
VGTAHAPPPTGHDCYLTVEPQLLSQRPPFRRPRRQASQDLHLTTSLVARPGSD